MAMDWVGDSVTATGFRLDELASAFDRVRDGQDWQGPVHGEIEGSQRDVTQQAVIWFTQTVPYFHPSPANHGRLIVTAPGHREWEWSERAGGSGSSAERRPPTGNA